jgi:hypothetical protein
MADSDRWIYPDKTSLDFDPQAFSDWSHSERTSHRIRQIERLRATELPLTDLESSLKLDSSDLHPGNGESL